MILRDLNKIRISSYFINFFVACFFNYAITVVFSDIEAAEKYFDQLVLKFNLKYNKTFESAKFRDKNLEGEILFGDNGQKSHIVVGVWET